MAPVGLEMRLSAFPTIKTIHHHHHHHHHQHHHHNHHSTVKLQWFSREKGNKWEKSCSECIFLEII